ncbi:MAG: D-galactarate dehydratase [Tabrizicola sp.]
MRYLALFPILAILLSGCALFQQKAADARPGPVTGPSEAQPATEIAPAVATTVLGARAVSAAALDRTTPEEKAAALSARATGGERQLGRVVVALGPPAEQGLWLSTALVNEVAQGRITTADGKSLAVELRPGTGAALLSLAAYQALGLPLTSLPEVTIFAR